MMSCFGRRSAKKNQRTKKKRSLVMREKRAIREWAGFDNTQTWDPLIE